MTPQLILDVIKSENLSEQERSEIIGLCSRAFNTNYEPLFQTFNEATHILARLQESLVSHALWITRYLKYVELPIFRTAYVEAVATEDAYRGRGFAMKVVQKLASEIMGFELGALSPSNHRLYVRLGWELWRGPLFISSPEGWVSTPDDEVMILRLPKTPRLDINAPLSAEWREGELW